MGYSRRNCLPVATMPALATLVALQLQENGLQCPTPTFATHASQLEAIRHQTEFQPSAKGLSWVSEFKAISQLDAHQPVPANARPIGTPSVGYIASASKKTIGIHRSPRVFMEAALEAKHPGFLSDQLPGPMKEAVTLCTSHAEIYVATSRSEALRAMIEEARQLSAKEAELKATMTGRRQTVLSRKRWLLFKSPRPYVV